MHNKQSTRVMITILDIDEATAEQKVSFIERKILSHKHTPPEAAKAYSAIFSMTVEEFDEKAVAYVGSVREAIEVGKAIRYNRYPNIEVTSTGSGYAVMGTR